MCQLTAEYRPISPSQIARKSWQAYPHRHQRVQSIHRVYGCYGRKYPIPRYEGVKSERRRLVVRQLTSLLTYTEKADTA